ncbi:pentapeptide repeat-containing protein [Nonomuraea sp. NPDC059194]|uniref:pentapeptide repeat-containing protein n=1 Tax=Nonomuraea sp. NPDC059194 TaxID=3346764 RepID=UPI0036D0916A
MRLTAQRILSIHLHDERPADQRSALPAALAFWEGMDLDLTGATLIDFNLAGGHVTDAILNKATFTGDARFNKVAFTGIAMFRRAAFSGEAFFNEATFTEDAWFSEATFTEDAWFNGATFTAAARFGEATFTKDASFRGARMAAHVWPDGWRLETASEEDGRLIRE